MATTVKRLLMVGLAALALALGALVAGPDEAAAGFSGNVNGTGDGGGG